MCPAPAKGIVISGQKADDVRGDNNLLIQSRLYHLDAFKILANAAIIFKAISPGVFKFRKVMGK